MYDNWVGVLQKSILFGNIDSASISSMLTCFSPHVKAYNKNENIAIAGDSLTEIGIVLSGETAIVKENFAGDRIIIAILGEGESFGEMGAFSRERVWPASVIAQSNVRIMFISPCKILFGCCNKCIGHERLIENFITMITEKALMLNRKVEYLGIKSVRSRISTFFLENYKKFEKNTFILPMKRNELADFLNITRPSLSREMCRMRDEGIIDFHLSTIKIIDMEELIKQTH